MQSIARVLVAFSTVAILAAGCGDSSAPVRHIDLTPDKNGFDPISLTAQPGDAIVFTNKLLEKARFVSDSPSGLFDSGDNLIGRGGAFEWPVPKTQPEGLIRYEEYLTGSYMGTISITLKAPGK